MKILKPVIIYKISCNKCKDCYIGSTKKTLNHRMKEHLSDQNLSNSKKILNCGDYKTEILEICYDSNYLEREQYYIDQNKNCVNINWAFKKNKNEFKKLARKTDDDPMRLQQNKYALKSFMKKYNSNPEFRKKQSDYYKLYNRQFKKITCPDCNASIKENNKSHQFTKKHLAAIKNK
jgi:hypothetical protein